MKVRIERVDGVVQTYYVKNLQNIREKYRYDKSRRVWFKPKLVKPKPKVVKGVIVTISLDYRSVTYSSKDIEIDAVAQHSVETTAEKIHEAVSKLRDKLVDFLLSKLRAEFGDDLIDASRLRIHYEVVDRRLPFDYDIRIRRRGGRWRRIT